MATTLLSLDKKLLESIGPFLQYTLTTVLTTDLALVSTNFLEARTTAGYFKNQWIYVEDFNNSKQSRILSADDGTNILTARGANFVSDGSDKATIRISPYSWDTRVKAIQLAINDVYPHIFRWVNDLTLITGNILPNAHFQDWASSTKPDKYSLFSVTATKETGVANVRGGALTSAKVAATSGNGYLYITSKDWPRLLDLMGETVTLKVWAAPQDANDGAIVIYTIQADGTEQTLTSSTSNPAGKYTLLKLEDQKLNDDLVEIQIRFKVISDTRYVYFDDARLTGRNVFEYRLPTRINVGDIHNVYIQTTGHSDDICDDLFGRWSKPVESEVFNDGTDSFLKLGLYTAKRRIRIEGKTTLEAISVAADTITPDGREVDLIIARAKYHLYRIAQGLPAQEDVGRLRSEEAKALFEYNQMILPFKMHSPAMKLRTGD